MNKELTIQDIKEAMDYIRENQLRWVTRDIFTEIEWSECGMEKIKLTPYTLDILDYYFGIKNTEIPKSPKIQEFLGIKIVISEDVK